MSLCRASCILFRIKPLCQATRRVSFGQQCKDLLIIVFLYTIFRITTVYSSLQKCALLLSSKQFVKAAGWGYRRPSDGTNSRYRRATGAEFAVWEVQWVCLMAWLAYMLSTDWEGKNWPIVVSGSSSIKRQRNWHLRYKIIATYLVLDPPSSVSCYTWL